MAKTYSFDLDLSADVSFTVTPYVRGRQSPMEPEELPEVEDLCVRILLEGKYVDVTDLLTTSFRELIEQKALKLANEYQQLRRESWQDKSDR